MPKFQTGENPEGIRSAQWIDSNPSFAFQVVRKGLGTADSAEYPHSAADLLLGAIADDGTTLNRLTVNTAGVIKVRNSLAGTINLYDPVILDFTNSGGTAGYVKTAYITENLAATAPVTQGTAGAAWTTGAEHSLANKAVPGSIRMLAKVGNGVPGGLQESGTVIVADGTHGFGTSTIAYTIDQPVIGHANGIATSPRQIFPIEVVKQRYIKNNLLN